MSARAAAAAIGYDGHPPELRVARDGVSGALNVNVDRLEWLLAHRLIDGAQHVAGRKLQRDYELSRIAGYAMTPGPLSVAAGRGGRSLPSDRQCDAIRRMERARVHVGSLGFRILELIVLESQSQTEAARRLGEPATKLPLALRVALDSLASHYALA